MSGQKKEIRNSCQEVKNINQQNYIKISYRIQIDVIDLWS